MLHRLGYYLTLLGILVLSFLVGGCGGSDIIVDGVTWANGVPFVDLYQPSTRLYAESADGLTINGIYVNEAYAEGTFFEADTLEEIDRFIEVIAEIQKFFGG